ncbi:Glutamyl-Q tRNA(Asp) synthetase [invertebrate metagenome]|uniref:Glutamyl-Q tRNA(Asp) synthetase n=1 Tax=invertebrate metagenome TaxID=1711999 RepID=A0A2H9T585_9ZZZZ
MDNHHYIGRFAPSPSGPLHFGSLVTALASFLDARANDGRWLVRIEDIDFPRVVSGAAEQILKALEVYGLHWDSSVLYQSQRQDGYQSVLDDLYKKGCLYPCMCTRKSLSAYHGLYPGFCRARSVKPKIPYALRLRCHDKEVSFIDRIQGKYVYRLTPEDDFILRRKDGLFAYQLAVCVDDDFQNITHIVRGCDLLEATPRQCYMQSLLGYDQPLYGHIPVITTASFGMKLSKQNHAKPLSFDRPKIALIRALKVLGLNAINDLIACSVADIIRWGIENWTIRKVPVKRAIEETEANTY